MVGYAFSECVPGKLRAEGWAAGIWKAAERGDIPMEKPPLMMNDSHGSKSRHDNLRHRAAMIWLFRRSTQRSGQR